MRFSPNLVGSAIAGIGVMAASWPMVAMADTGVSQTFDARMVISMLSGALTVMVGLYCRGIEAKLDTKADKDYVRQALEMMTKLQGITAEHVKGHSTELSYLKQSVHEMELTLVKSHPTKEELREVINASLAPVKQRLDDLKTDINQLSKEIER